MKKPLILTLGALLGIAVVAVAFLPSLRGHQQKDLDDYGSAPSFKLTERAGYLVDSERLKGEVWVAGFVFTRCAGQCPMISAQMERLQKKLHAQPRFQLISITVDADYDTPQRLATYAKKWEADPKRWWFLTGDAKEIHDLIEKGFHLSAGTPAPGGDLIHTAKLVLVDPNGEIRGYYDGLDSNSVDELARDARQLLREAKG